jgi:hypothetical protein
MYLDLNLMSYMTAPDLPMYLAYFTNSGMELR